MINWIKKRILGYVRCSVCAKLTQISLTGLTVCSLKCATINNHNKIQRIKEKVLLDCKVNISHHEESEEARWSVEWISVNGTHCRAFYATKKDADSQCEHLRILSRWHSGPMKIYRFGGRKSE